MLLCSHSILNSSNPSFRGCRTNIHMVSWPSFESFVCLFFCWPLIRMLNCNNLPQNIFTLRETYIDLISLFFSLLLPSSPFFSLLLPSSPFFSLLLPSSLRVLSTSFPCPFHVRSSPLLPTTSESLIHHRPFRTLIGMFGYPFKGHHLTTIATRHFPKPHVLCVDTTA
eukprot:TRINITY_DN4573_c0_g1_i4.p1 TRINITY_DN4573_c0_g1~~TRINITY_DN4573_c0_g1_i4.p1  ORF type:complete len:168 (+),score=8.38 TRINITY_DN4573_c0_g1_i4:271-774(+)